MGIFIRRTKSGIYPFWLGFWQEDGKRHETTLIPWRGTPPERGEKKGDMEFELSRRDAQNLFKQIRAEGRGKEEEAALVRKIHAARYGGKVDRVKLSELAARWDALPHKADMTADRRKRVHSVLARFVTFMGETFPRVTEVGALLPVHFKDFFESVDASGVSGRTWNDVLQILRGVLRRVDGASVGFREYLQFLPMKDEKTVHRKPFTSAELAAIFTAAQNLDPELFPVLVAAAFTALRRGDVCRLRWDAVDFQHNRIVVRTNKTGEVVRLPILAELRAVLEEAAAKRKKGVPYVWPRIAIEYNRNANGLNLRLRKVLRAAGFVRPKKAGEEEGKYPTPEDEEAATAMLEDGMTRAGWTEKRKAKARRILALHFQGLNGKAIAAEIGTSKGAISDYFKAMEECAHVALVSPPKRDIPAQATLAEIGDGEQRKHRGSLYGWHAFRTSLVSHGLAAGMDKDALVKITGHKNEKMLERFYDRRDAEDAFPEFEKLETIYRPARFGNGGTTAGETAVAPANVAEIARLLTTASAEDLEKVAKLLKKKGGDK